MPRQTPLALRQSSRTVSRLRLRRPAFERLERRELLAFNVAGADVVFSANYRLLVDFNAAVAGATVAASDVKVDGVSATSFTAIDADTYEFVLPTLAAGTRAITIAAGAMNGGALNEPIDAFNKSVVVTSAVQYAMKYNPRLQPGNAPLTSAVVNGSVVTYAGGDKDRVDLIWETISGGAGTQDSFTVQYRATGSNAPWQSGTINSTINTGVGGRIVHSASITGLNWNSNYDYRVFHRRGDVVVSQYAATFKTRLAQGDTSNFSFATYGDSAHTSTVANFRSVQSRINQMDPRFVVLLGDNVYDSGSHTEADARFDPVLNPESAAWMATHIDYLGLGNHDNLTGNGLPTTQLYSVPIQVAGVNAPATPPAANGAEHNFSFDYGDVHFVTFDTDKWQTSGRNSAVLDAQLDYVIADLNASTARWKIVYGHHPVGGTPDKGESPSDYYWQQVVGRFKEAGVDLFMTGHSHTYAWTYPLTGQSGGQATYVDRGDYAFFYHEDGLPQLVSGTGGRDLRTGSFTQFPFVAAGFSSTTPVKSEFGFTMVDVTQNDLTVKYIAADDGAVIDQFVITKAAPPTTETVTFQQGVSGYTGAVDTYIAQSAAGTANGAATTLIVDGQDSATTPGPVQGLLRFEDLFGSGPNKVPTNVEITSATLQFQVTNAGDALNFHRMLQNWGATATWNTLAGGVSANNVEAVSTIDGTMADASNATVPFTASVNVLASVRAWQAGTANHGWAILPIVVSGADGVQFDSSEGVVPPKLSITYIVDTVTPAPPVAVNDSASALVNTPVTIAVLGNDTDINRNPLTIESVTQPAHGTVTFTGETVRYTPTTNYVGSDTFTYTINDGTGFTAIGVVTIDVALPTANLVFMQGCEGCPISCGCGYRGTIDTFLRGDVPGANNSTVAALMVDGDSPVAQTLLRFEDLFGTNAWQIPANATIKAAELQLQVTDAGAGLEFYRMLQAWNDTDSWSTWGNGIQTNGVEAATTADATISAVSGTNIKINVLSSLLAWQADSSKNFGWAIRTSGTDAVQFSSSDGIMPPRLVVTLSVNEQVAPGAIDDYLFTDRNTTKTLAVLANDVDLNADALSLVGVTQPAHGAVTVNGNVVTYIPTTGYAGDDAFTYTITDGALQSTATVHVKVAPTTNLVLQQGVSGYAGTVDTHLRNDAVTTNHATTSPLVVDGASPTAHGLLRFNNLFGNAANQIPSGATITAATLEFNVVNTGTPISLHRMLSDWQDTATWNSFTTGIQANGVEAVTAADAVSVSTVGQVAPLVLTVDVLASLQAWQTSTNFGWAILPTGDDGVQYDSAQGASPPVLRVTFTSGNVAPLPGNDIIATSRNVVVNIPVLTNDSDANGDLITVTATTTPANGKAVLNSDNTVTYIPNVGYTGSDSFSYTISDGTATAQGTVNITIALPTATATFQQGVSGYNFAVDTYLAQNTPTTAFNTSASLKSDNDDPAGTGFDAQALLWFKNIIGTGAGQIPATATVQSATLQIYVTNSSVSPMNVHRMAATWADAATWNSFGADGITATGAEALAAVDASFAVPTVNQAATANVLSSIQAWQLNPANNFGWALLPTGTDGVDFVSADGATTMQRPLLTVQYVVPATNTPPVAQDDAISTMYGIAATFNVRTNDTDADGDTLTVQSFSRPLHGTVVLNGSNQLIYTPEAGYIGTDTFQYVVSDGKGGAATASVNLTVQSTNAAPEAILLTGGTVAENSDNIVVGTLSATDPDAGDTHTFTTSDTRFTIVGDQLRLKAGAAFNFETTPSVLVSITATDSGSPTQSLTQSVTVNVANVNEAPSAIALTGSIVAENNAGAVIGTLSATDVDASSTHTFTTSDTRFTIVGNQLRLVAGQSLDFEATSSVQVSITATDNGSPALGVTQSVTINVTNVNDAPTAIMLAGNTVVENSTAVSIGVLSATDPDTATGFTYSTTDTRFVILGDLLRLAPGQSLNYEAASSIAVPITVSDNGTPVATFTQNLTVQVQDVAEPPSNITLSREAVFSAINGAWVATFSTTDPEGSANHTYSFSDNRFEFRDGSLFVKAGSSVFAWEVNVPLTITVHDGAMSFSKEFTLTVDAAPAAWTSAHEWRPLPVDVNADGFVAPLDALLIIIDLNTGGARPLPAATPGTRAPLFLDVSGDGFVAPEDALAVINWLNAGGGGAGEIAAAFTPVAATEPSAASDPAAPLWIEIEARSAESLSPTAGGPLWEWAVAQVAQRNEWGVDPRVFDAAYARDGADSGKDADDDSEDLLELLLSDASR